MVPATLAWKCGRRLGYLKWLEHCIIPRADLRLPLRPWGMGSIASSLQRELDRPLAHVLRFSVLRWSIFSFPKSCRLYVRTYCTMYMHGRRSLLLFNVLSFLIPRSSIGQKTSLNFDIADRVPPRWKHGRMNKGIDSMSPWVLLSFLYRLLGGWICFAPRYPCRRADAAIG